MRFWRITVIRRIRRARGQGVTVSQVVRHERAEGFPDFAALSDDLGERNLASVKIEPINEAAFVRATRSD